MKILPFQTIPLALFLLSASNAGTQQVPKNDPGGNPICVLRNDSTASTTIEYRKSGQWQPLKIEPGKDATVTGDRIRVATTREDRAVVTVELPTQAGKKYRLFWNAQTSTWDFSAAS